MALNQSQRISNRSVGQLDQKNWIAEGDGLLASAEKTRTIWMDHRRVFSQTVQQRRSRDRDASADWNLLLGLPRSSMLLLGYSVEMYLKAGLVRAYHGCSEDMFKRDIKNRYGHRLVSMANEIALSLDQNDEKSLNLIMDMVLFDARYPVFVPPTDSYANTINQQTERIWSAESFANFTKLANRIKTHSKRIDADPNKPASFLSFNVDSDGYLAFRVGGHLPPRITFRASSEQVQRGETTSEDMKKLFPKLRFPQLVHWWHRAWIYEDGEHKTSCCTRPTH